MKSWVHSNKMKFQTSKSSILNVFWWRRGMGFRNGESLSMDTVIGLRVYPCPTNPNIPEQKHGFSCTFNEVAMEDSPWVWYDGKVSAGETKKNCRHQACFTSKFGTPQAILEVLPEMSPILLGSTEKRPQTLRKSFQRWDLFRSTTKLFLASRFAPSGAISSTDSHLPCVCQSLKFLNLGMVIGHPTFNIFNDQNSTNPEVDFHPHPLKIDHSPFPTTLEMRLCLNSMGFGSHAVEFHAFSIFSACIGCTSTKGIVFCWIPGVQNEGLGGYREMVIPTSSRWALVGLRMNKFSQLIGLTSPSFVAEFHSDQNFPSSWVKTPFSVEVDLVTLLDTEPKTELMIAKQPFRERCCPYTGRKKNHRRFIFSNLVGRMIWLLGIG